GRTVRPVSVQEGPERRARDGHAGVGDRLDQLAHVQLTGQRQAEPVEGLELRLELPTGVVFLRLRALLAQRLFRTTGAAQSAAENADEAALDEEEAEIQGARVAGRQGDARGCDQVV